MFPEGLDSWLWLCGTATAAAFDVFDPGFGSIDLSRLQPTGSSMVADAARGGQMSK